VRDGRKVTRGKRKEKTRGIWRPGRIRNTIVEPVYKGVHYYGRRSKKQREVIERAVPAIVSEETWERAQETLRKNFLFNKRSAKRQYLLRGLIKCGMCGLTYIGTGYPAYRKRGVKKQGIEKGPVFHSYYACNGKHNSRGLYAERGEKCPSKSIGGDIEEIVWRDIETFLRNPGDVLEELQARREAQSADAGRLRDDLAKLRQAEKEKAKERDAVVTLFRKGRIKESALNTQLDAIEREETALRFRIETLERQVQTAVEQGAQLNRIEVLLAEINSRLDQPLTWECKREIVELLVESIRVETVEDGDKKAARVVVTYRFDEPCSTPQTTPTEIGTGVRADSSATSGDSANARSSRSAAT